MPAPLAVAAAAAAARLLARKIAKDSAKKAVKKATKSNAKAVKSSRKDINKEVKVIQKANAKGLKAAQGKSLAPKKYKPDTEGRKQVKRFAAPLEKANGKKTAMRLGAQTIDIGRSSLKIKPAPKNRGK